jgi:hypothetical protein
MWEETGAPALEETYAVGESRPLLSHEEWIQE